MQHCTKSNFSIEKVRKDLECNELHSTRKQNFIRNEDESYNELPPSVEETQEAIKNLKNGRAAGPDEVQAELFKYGGAELTFLTAKIMQACWNQRSIPHSWQHSTIICLYKGKGAGSMRDTNSYRGISLLTLGNKILTNIIHTRLTNRIERSLLETQNAYRRNRGTTDAIFSLRRLIELHRNQTKPLYIVYVDIKKAFDSLPRDAIWEVLRNINIKGTLLEMIQVLYKNTTADVKLGTTTSVTFETTTGVKQGCAMSGTLFIAVFDAILRTCTRDHNSGITVKWRIPKGRKCRGDTVGGTEGVGHLAYADDLCICSNDINKLRNTSAALASTLEYWGLSININKTKIQVLQQEKVARPVSIMIKGQELEQVKVFMYLGSIIEENGEINATISHNIRSAWSKIKYLDRLWNNSTLSRNTKTRFFKAFVIPRLTYACSTWAVDERQLKWITKEYMKMAMKASGIFATQLIKVQNELHGPDEEEHIYLLKRRSHEEILSTSRLPHIREVIEKQILSYAGHVARMGPERLPNKLLFGTIDSEKKLKRDPPHIRTIYRCLHKTGISPENWKQASQNRAQWKKDIDVTAQPNSLRRRRAI